MNNPTVEQHSNTPVHITEMEHVEAVEEGESLEEIDPDNYEDLEEVPVIHLQDIHVQPQGSAPAGPTNNEGMESLVLEAIDLEEGDGDAVILMNPPNANRIPQASAIRTASTGEDSAFVSLRNIPIGEDTSRAEFISVLLAPTAGQTQNTSRIGIRFFPDHAGEIARIEEDSILSHSPLRAGDVIVSLNGKACERKTSRDIAALILQNGNRYLHMLFRNPMEDARVGLVHYMLEKITPEGDLGVNLGNFPGGEIRFTQIRPRGLGEKSSLNVGDTILEVNGTSCAALTLYEAVHLLRRATKYVNILVRVGANTAVVVSELSTRMTHIPNVNTTGVRELDAAHRVEDRLEPEAERRPTCGCVFLFCMLGLCLLIVVISMLDGSSNDQSYTYADDYFYRNPCQEVSGFAEDMSFQFTNNIQTSTLFETFYSHANDGEAVFNNTNATTADNYENENIDLNSTTNNETVLRMSSSMYGHFGLFPSDGRSVDELPTNLEIDQLLQNTSQFFALVLEEDDNTRDSFLSLQLVFQSWSYTSCPDSFSSDLDIIVMVGAAFSKNNLEEYYLKFPEELFRQVESTLSWATYDDYYSASEGNYIRDYVRTVGNESLFGTAYYATWS